MSDRCARESRGKVEQGSSRAGEGEGLGGVVSLRGFCSICQPVARKERKRPIAPTTIRTRSGVSSRGGGGGGFADRVLPS